jgi:DNA topoisomerase-1
LPDRKLLIIESPAKARSLRTYLGDDYDIVASNGHVRDLPRRRLAVKEDGSFEPTYTVLPEARKTVAMLKKKVRDFDKVYLAADPDREGEAICWHLSQLLDGENRTFKRLRFNAITRDTVLRSLKRPQGIDMNLVDSQQARRVMDRLVGYKVSPYLWRTLGKGLSAGRVQTVALRVVKEREDEISAFEPHDYWLIFADFEVGGKTLRAGLHKRSGKRVDTEKSAPSSKEAAEKLMAEVRRLDWKVAKVDRKTVAKSPAPPYITSTLQQSAARRLSLSPSRTMRLAQQLYEGVEIAGGETSGLITYMRTDSVRVSPSAIEGCRRYVASSFGKDALYEKPRRFRSAKSAQDAHEAIRPTDVTKTPESLSRHLLKDQLRLYDLIWRRFVATQMRDAGIARTKVSIRGDKLEFFCSGERLIEPGFSRVDPGQLRVGSPLPEVQKGPAKLLDAASEKRTTRPPSRYTEAGLVAEMKKLGIGRPSTYVSIIDTLKRRKYVVLEARKLHVTELGATTAGLLVELFPDIFDPGFTASMEELLDDIAGGEIGYREALENLSQPLSSSLEIAMENIEEVRKRLVQPTDERCPKCGSRLTIRWGKYGRFYACSAFPACRYTRPLDAPSNEEIPDRKCPECGGKLVLRNGRYGPFLACENSPDCKHTESMPTGVRCPEPSCDGELVVRRTRKGRIFYSCNRYPECKFAMWNKPVDKKCPRCGYPILEQRKRGIYCPNCKKKIESS